MKDLKFLKDLGITAVIAIEVVTFVFIILIIALLTDKVQMAILLPVLGGWVGTVLGAYFTLKSAKDANHRGE